MLSRNVLPHPLTDLGDCTAIAHTLFRLANTLFDRQNTVFAPEQGFGRNRLNAHHNGSPLGAKRREICADFAKLPDLYLFAGKSPLGHNRLHQRLALAFHKKTEWNR
jgi:hypothetical protein